MATKTASTAAVTLQGSCQLARDANGYRVEEVWGGGGQTGEITVVARTKTAMGLGLLGCGCSGVSGMRIGGTQLESLAAL